LPAQRYDSHDGIVQVEVSFSETYLSLKQRAALLFNIHAQEIVFLFRDDLSISIRDDDIVGRHTIPLCEKQNSPFFRMFQL
jgi:hypothetical protein